MTNVRRDANESRFSRGGFVVRFTHVSRLAGGQRRITRISELIGLRKGQFYRVRDIFLFEQTGVVNGHAVGNFRVTGHVPQMLAKFAAAGHPLPEKLFAERSLGHVAPPAEGGPVDA